MIDDKSVLLEIKIRKKRIDREPERITMDHNLFGKIDKELLA